MKTITLTESTGFVDPGLFNLMRGGARRKVVVGDDGKLLVEGVQLVFRDPTEALPPGTAVEVWLARDYVCATEQELAREAEVQASARQKEAAAWQRKLIDAEANARCVNGAIKLPVKWTVGIKDVLSGLSERSDGSGRNKATVNHIFLLEDLNEGRLRRKSEDLLCTSASGSNGKRWSKQSTEGYEADARSTLAVTCKQCLEIAQTLTQRRASKQAADGLSVTGHPNLPMPASRQKMIFDNFLQKGDSFHSPRAQVAWAIMDQCERQRIPYRVEAARMNGSIAGVRIVRTDRDVPPMKPMEGAVVWNPVTEDLKRDPGFSAIGRDAEGREFTFWNGGGDWLCETSGEEGYSEDLCSPVEWRELQAVEVLKEWKPELVAEAACSSLEP